VAKAPPDGYTLLLATSNMVSMPSLLPSLPYDTIKDFAPVGTLAISQYVLVLNPSVPANTLQEFIALARAKPDQLNYASSGVGGAPHLAGELFNMMVGVRMRHIPYKGAGPALTDLLGGQVQLYFNTPISSIPHIQSAKLKAIAITGEKRLAALPQVLTFTEAGLPGFEISTWFAIVAPAGTPKAIIDKMSSEMGVFLAMPDTQESLAKLAMEPFISTPDQLTALIKTGITKFAKIIKTANIKLDN